MHGSGHGQDARCVSQIVLDAVLGELSLDGVARSAGSGALGAAALNHEAVDNAVEIQSVIETLLHEADEIVDCVGGDFRIKLRFDDIAIFHFKGFFCIGYLNPELSGQKLSGCRILLEGFEEIDQEFLEQVHTRALGLPVTIAETARLRIREMTLSDLPELNRICRENGLPETGEEEAKAYIRYMYGLYQCGMWVVLEKESCRIIGRAGFGIADYLPEAELDLGYLIDTPYRRQGYGEEACRAVLAYGKEVLELPEISAYAEAENTASCHLLEKLGFGREQEFFCKEQKMYRYRKALAADKNPESTDLTGA